MVDAAPSKSLLVNGAIDPVSKSPLVMSSAGASLVLDDDGFSELVTVELDDVALLEEELVALFWLLAFDEEAGTLTQPANARAVPTKTNRNGSFFIFCFPP